MEMQGCVLDKTAFFFILNYLIWLIWYSGEVWQGFYIECFWMEMKGFALEKVTYIASHFFQFDWYNLLGKFDKKCLFLYFPRKRILVKKLSSLMGGQFPPLIMRTYLAAVDINVLNRDVRFSWNISSHRRMHCSAREKHFPYFHQGLVVAKNPCPSFWRESLASKKVTTPDPNLIFFSSQVPTRWS